MLWIECNYSEVIQSSFNLIIHIHFITFNSNGWYTVIIVIHDSAPVDKRHEWCDHKEKVRIHNAYFLTSLPTISFLRSSSYVEETSDKEIKVSSLDKCEKQSEECLVSDECLPILHWNKIWSQLCISEKQFEYYQVQNKLRYY